MKSIGGNVGIAIFGLATAHEIGNLVVTTLHVANKRFAIGFTKEVQTVHICGHGCAPLACSGGEIRELALQGLRAIVDAEYVDVCCTKLYSIRPDHSFGNIARPPTGIH